MVLSELGHTFTDQIKQNRTGRLLTGLSLSSISGGVINMSDTVSLHPVKITLNPYPAWERFRVAFECLILGEVSFQGQITNVSAAQQKDTVPLADPALKPDRRR